MARNNAPNEMIACQQMIKFESTGPVQDATTPTRQTQITEGRLLSSCGDHNWPLRLCDLTPPNFFLWGSVKAYVYENKPRTIKEIKD